MYASVANVQQVAVFLDDGHAVEQFPVNDSQPERVAEGGETFGETFTGDYPHEADKMLSLFSLHWDAALVLWDDVYSVVQPPDPVFSFERPPKPLAA